MPQADLTDPPKASVVLAAGLAGELALVSRAPTAFIDRDLLAAYARAAAPNSLRAFRSDVTAFDTWCRIRGLRSLPASQQVVVEFLKARAEEGAAPASLTRYRASLSKLHRLCRLPDPC